MFKLPDQELSIYLGIKRCRTVPYGIQDSSGSKLTWVKEDNNRADVWLLWVTVGLLIKYSFSVEEEEEILLLEKIVSHYV